MARHLLTTVNRKQMVVVGACYLATILLGLVLANWQLRRVVAMEKRQQYEERIAEIARELQTREESLGDGASRDEYLPFVQNAAVDQLRERYYADSSTKAYPLILGADGELVLYPGTRDDWQEGTAAQAAATMAERRSGAVSYRFKGEKRWMTFGEFGPWRWVVAYTIPHDLMFREVRRFERFYGLVMTACLLTGLLLCMHFLSRVLAPLRDTSAYMSQMAAGAADLSRRIPVSQSDEVGVLAGGFNDFVTKLSHNMQNIAAGVHSLRSLTRGFVGNSQQGVSLTGAIADRSAGIAASAEQTSAAVETISVATHQLEALVTTAAASLDEISTASGEVLRHCRDESEAASGANRRVRAVNDMMSELDAAAGQIGTVVEVIEQIAGQTKLLALNASIEAASAGEAGKGFGVVAGEVKTLARETSEATSRIAKQVEQVRAVVGSSVRAMGEIAETVSELVTLSHSVSKVVEEQSEAVYQVAASMSEAREAAQSVATGIERGSHGLSDIAANVHSVTDSARDAAHHAAQVGQAARQLDELAVMLNRVVRQFADGQPVSGDDAEKVQQRTPLWGAEDLESGRPARPVVAG